MEDQGTIEKLKMELENERIANNCLWIGYIIGFLASFFLSFAFLARFMP